MKRLFCAGCGEKLEIQDIPGDYDPETGVQRCHPYVICPRFALWEERWGHSEIRNLNEAVRNPAPNPHYARARACSFSRRVIDFLSEG